MIIYYLLRYQNVCYWKNYKNFMNFKIIIFLNSQNEMILKKNNVLDYLVLFIIKPIYFMNNYLKKLKF